MSFFLKWFRSNAVKRPETYPEDEVIQLYSQDDQAQWRDVAVDFSMRFDDVLDVEKLSGAFEKLLNMPGWRKLGARLRLNKDNKLEYHIPKEYTKERPPVNFTHVTHDIIISEHPLASKLLRPNGSFQVSENLPDFEPLLVSPECPRQMNDWILTDKASLSLHVVSFTDATLVTLTWLHTFLDAMGRKALIDAWIAVLEGRKDDVPDFYAYDFDPLASLGEPIDPKLKTADTPMEEPFVLESKIVKGFGMLRLIFNMLWEIYVHRKEEMRIVIMPASFYKKLRATAFKDLETTDPSTVILDTRDARNPKPFLSDGDILNAWWTRLHISCQPWASSANPTRTIQAMNALNLRPVLTSTEPQLLPQNAAYIPPAVAQVASFFTFQELLTLPLGHVAARIRKDLAMQSTRPQVNAAQRLAKQSKAESGYPALYGDGGMFFTVFSNWMKAKMFDVDFSAAVVKRADDKSEGKHVKGKPTYLHANMICKGIGFRNTGPLLGRDNEGNWWISFLLRRDTWGNVRRALEGME